MPRIARRIIGWLVLVAALVAIAFSYFRYGGEVSINVAFIGISISIAVDRILKLTESRT